MPFVQLKGRTVPCQGILFDKDGTLLHFMALWGGWADYVLEFMEERLELMGSGFTLPKEKVLGTKHDAGGRVSGYDLRGPLAMGTVEETNGLLAWQLYAAGMPWNEAIVQVHQINEKCHVRSPSAKAGIPNARTGTFPGKMQLGLREDGSGDFGSNLRCRGAVGMDGASLVLYGHYGKRSGSKWQAAPRNDRGGLPPARDQTGGSGRHRRQQRGYADGEASRRCAGRRFNDG